MVKNNLKVNCANLFFILAPLIFILGNLFLNLFFFIFLLLLSFFIHDLINFIKTNRKKIITFLIIFFSYYVFFFILKDIDNFKIITPFKFILLFVIFSIYFPYIKLDLVSKFWFLILIFILTDTLFQYFTGSDIFGFKSQVLSLDFCTRDDVTGTNIFNLIENSFLANDRDCPVYKRTLRLSGPFGDEYVVGGFLLNFCIITISLLKNEKKIIKFFLFLSSMIIIIFTGERMASILIFFSLFLYFFISSSNLKIFLLKLIIIFLVAFLYLNFDKRTYLRFQEIGTISNNFEDKKNPYFSLFFRSSAIFKENFFIGSGPRSFRVECRKQKYQNKKQIDCKNHPHNIYFEILSEMGIYGFLFFLFIIYNFLFRIKLKYILNKKLDHQILSLISIIILLFPFRTSGSIFSTFYGYYFWFFIFFSYFLLVPRKIDK